MDRYAFQSERITGKGTIIRDCVNVNSESRNDFPLRLCDFAREFPLRREVRDGETRYAATKKHKRLKNETLTILVGSLRVRVRERNRADALTSRA